MVRALKMPSGADATAFEARTAQRVKDLESILKEYGTSSPGVDRR
jgi:hypothetical protein